MNAFSQNDAISIYRTSDDGRRTGVELPRTGGIFSGGPANVIIGAISRNCGDGVATLAATGADTLSFAAPDEEHGTAVAVPPGESRILRSATASKWMRVTRTSDAALAGAMTISVTETMLPDISDADRAAGISVYSQFMIVNHSNDPADQVRMWASPITAANVTDVSALPSSGSGPISSTSSFASWPESGFARIETNAGELREIVYYVRDKMSPYVLDVVAAHRGLLGTSEGAGELTDTIRAIHGCAIGIEPLDADGFMQPNADQHTPPIGVTFRVPISSSDAIDIGEIARRRGVGLWLWHQIPPGMIGGKLTAHDLMLAFRTGGTTFTEPIRAVRFVRDSGLRRYNVYIGIDEMPDLYGEPQFSTADMNLPIVVPFSAPPSGTSTLRIVVRPVNDIGLESLSAIAGTLTIDSGGNVIRPAVSAPRRVSLEDVGAGRVRVIAEYDISADAQPADTWRIYVRDNGTDPDPDIDDPMDIPMLGLNGIDMYIKLVHVLGPVAWGSDVRVLVRTRNAQTDADSVNTDAHGIIVTSRAPDCPPMFSAGAGSVLGTVALDAESFERITELNASPRVEIVQRAGITELLCDGDAVWRIIWNGDAAAGVHLPATWRLRNGTVSGAGSAEAIEVVDADTLYVCVNAQRVALIDRAAGEIVCGEFRLNDADLRDVAPLPDAAIAGDDATLFQAWDRHSGRWRTAIVATPGVLATSIPIIQHGE